MAPFYTLSVALQILATCTFTSSQQFCSSRRLGEWSSDIQSQSSDCPYHVDTHSWIPGGPVTMQLTADVEEDYFQSYIVSVQQGNSLIGNMSSDDGLSKPACRDTSVINVNNENKTIVEFSWSPPSDMNTNQDIFIRYSAGRTDEEFWVDCGGTVLRSADDQEVTTAVTDSNPTKDARVAAPDVRDGGPTRGTRPAAEQTTPTPTTTAAEQTTGAKTTVAAVTSENECERGGITYSVVAGTDCQEFRMEWSAGSSDMKCPQYTAFNIDNCACSLAWLAQCQ